MNRKALNVFYRMLVIALCVQIGGWSSVSLGGLETGGYGGSGSSASGGDCKTSTLWSCTQNDAQPICETLNSLKEGATPNSASLASCLSMLQGQLTGSLAEKKKKAMALGSVKEKTFLGFVLTCYGEADPKSTPADRMAIMKTLENRTNRCQEQLSDKKYSVMEVALQDKQFSMYNDAIYKSPGAFEAKPSDQKMKDCLDAFAKHATAKLSDFQPEEKSKKVMYYYATKVVTPPWSKPADFVDMTINNGSASGGSQKVNGDIHKFQASPWDCLPYAKKQGKS